ncbi:hypothetical protein PFISCL1PPCAC_1598, partial [Pristionchus fissidentatus]
KKMKEEEERIQQLRNIPTSDREERRNKQEEQLLDNALQLEVQTNDTLNQMRQCNENLTSDADELRTFYNSLGISDVNRDKTVEVAAAAKAIAAASAAKSKEAEAQRRIFVPAVFGNSEPAADLEETAAQRQLVAPVALVPAAPAAKSKEAVAHRFLVVPSVFEPAADLEESAAPRRVAAPSVFPNYTDAAKGFRPIPEGNLMYEGAGVMKSEWDKISAFLTGEELNVMERFVPRYLHEDLLGDLNRITDTKDRCRVYSEYRGKLDAGMGFVEWHSPIFTTDHFRENKMILEIAKSVRNLLIHDDPSNVNAITDTLIKLRMEADKDNQDDAKKFRSAAEKLKVFLFFHEVEAVWNPIAPPILSQNPVRVPRIQPREMEPLTPEQQDILGRLFALGIFDDYEKMVEVCHIAKNIDEAANLMLA